MTIAVYGLGRFGYFWAELLSTYFSVKAYSRSDRRKTPKGVIRVSEEELLEQPVIFLCTAISSMDEVLQRIGPGLKPDCLVMDTCSVKVHPAALMERYLPGEVAILATHPMFGPDSAGNGVAGLPMILCPVRVSDEKKAEWEGFFKSLGLRVFSMTPHDHDREAAFTQGITHYMGRVLNGLHLKQSEMGTLGYRKLLEIMEQTCNDPWELFIDLQRFNPYTKEMREKLHSSLDRILAKLEGSLDNEATEIYHKKP